MTPSWEGSGDDNIVRSCAPDGAGRGPQLAGDGGGRGNGPWSCCCWILLVRGPEDAGEEWKERDLDDLKVSSSLNGCKGRRVQKTAPLIQDLVRSKSGNPRRLMVNISLPSHYHRDVLGYDSFPDHNLPDRVSLDARLFRKARYLLRLEDGEAWDRLEQTDKLLDGSGLLRRERLGGQGACSKLRMIAFAEQRRVDHQSEHVRIGCLRPPPLHSAMFLCILPVLQQTSNMLLFLR
mmetsp:Transcript_4713/g.11224  ORF Transcript_4713/g.11224 Transcript_4713/m.11224 type:complete len:235 (-) Transcript_4713:526-1230(-)